MMMITKLVFFFSTIYVLIVLIRYFISDEENDITRILKEIKGLNKDKKRVFIIYFFLFSPFYPLSVLFRLFFFIIIILSILINLPLNMKMQRKIKDWNFCNYSYANLKIIQLILIINKDGLINCYNSAFIIIYKRFFPKMKINYKDVLNHFTFIKSTGTSLNYLNFILNFTKKYDSRKIKKKPSLKVKIRIKRILNALIMVINSDFIRETSECTMRIIVKDFKISTNCKDIKCLENIINKKGALWKIEGFYVNKNDPKLIPHIYASRDNKMVGFTSSPRVRTWEKNVYVKSHLCGIQRKGNYQYCVPFEKGDRFDDNFEVYNHIPRDLGGKFVIGYRDEFIGFTVKNSMFLSSHNMNETLIKGEKVTKGSIEIKKILDLNDEQKNMLKSISNEEMGRLSKKHLKDEDLFYIERGYYDKVVKPKSKDDYYYDP